MTKNKRYEAHFDLMNDDRMMQAASHLMPTTLPMQACGPRPVARS